jgi:hypothetical protein
MGSTTAALWGAAWHDEDQQIFQSKFLQISTVLRGLSLLAIELSFAKTFCLLRHLALPWPLAAPLSWVSRFA